MKGTQHVEVSNRNAKFRFDLHRNITIVRGDSGTGKTTLYNMIADYTRLQAESGVNLTSTKPCVALMDMDWKNQLDGISNSIVFIDEGATYISSEKFAEAIKNSDNYYVIFNREGLHQLPYSVEEIYQIKTSGKYHSFEQIYKPEKLHRYTKFPKSKRKDFQVLLTEDSHSGYQFFCAYFEGTSVHCATAGSNSAIFKWLNNNPTGKVLIIADGAAFGSEMDRVLKLCKTHPETFQLCLPESFEWLILKSGIIHAEHLVDILKNPGDYIESQKFFSWENFFEDFLVQETRRTPFQYAKSNLNDVYKQKANQKRIAAEIMDVD